LAIFAIFRAGRISDCSSCTRSSCLAIVADMLKTYKKLVTAFKKKLRLLSQLYMTPYPPPESLNPDLSTPVNLYHEIGPRKSHSWTHNEVQFDWLCGQMASSTMEICHCGQLFIGHGGVYIHQLYNIF
jgi:hypothetical protein